MEDKAGCLPDWNELPEEVTIRIFTYLPKRSFSTLVRVCAQWRRIADDRFFWPVSFVKSGKRPRAIKRKREAAETKNGSSKEDAEQELTTTNGLLVREYREYVDSTFERKKQKGISVQQLATHGAPIREQTLFHFGV